MWTRCILLFSDIITINEDRLAPITMYDATVLWSFSQTLFNSLMDFNPGLIFPQGRIYRYIYFHNHRMNSIVMNRIKKVEFVLKCINYFMIRTH